MTQNEMLAFDRLALKAKHAYLCGLLPLACARIRSPQSISDLPIAHPCGWASAASSPCLPPLPLLASPPLLLPELEDQP